MLDRSLPKGCRRDPPNDRRADGELRTSDPEVRDRSHHRWLAGREGPVEGGVKRAELGREIPKEATAFVATESP